MMPNALATQNMPSKTAPAKATPSLGIGGLSRDIDRLFESFLPRWMTPSLSQALKDTTFTSAFEIWPVVDVSENADAYEISAELPGVSQSDIDLRLSGNTMTIRGEKTESKETNDKDRHISERRYGTFSRSFTLPDGIDAEKISASYRDGILKVALPKSIEAKKNEKKIEIKLS